MISSISSTVSSESWLFLTSISIMLGLPSRESLRVAALESSMKLQEMSKILMDLFSFRNSARDSQNMCPSELEERDKLSRLELLLRRSMHNLDPALSSSLFSFRDKWLRILFTFRAYARYLDPS